VQTANELLDVCRSTQACFLEQSKLDKAAAVS
jgi:hypothetical protein